MPRWAVRRTPEIAFNVGVVLAVAWIIWQAIGSGPLREMAPGWLAPWVPRGWGPRSGLFPLVISIPVLLLALAQLMLTSGGVRGTGTGENPSVRPFDVAPAVVRRRSAIIIITIVGFAVAVVLLGFTVAIPLVTFLYLKLGTDEPWSLSVGLAVGSGVFFYALFVRALNVPSPPGLLLAPLLG
ncbi:MAG: hypothetical protein GEU73_12165 [Chloroflexi bacterium]|nr:hypothetical protein [Chloroflexota bacterium]